MSLDPLKYSFSITFFTLEPSNPFTNPYLWVKCKFYYTPSTILHNVIPELPIKILTIADFTLYMITVPIKYFFFCFFHTSAMVLHKQLK